MFDPSVWTLGQVSSTARDLSIVGFLMGAAWKGRGVYESVTGFVDRIVKHMEVMEKFADVTVNNHLKHIEENLDVLSRRKNTHDFVFAQAETVDPLLEK